MGGRSSPRSSVSLSEHATDTLDACHEGVDLLLRIVDSEGGTHRTEDAETVHQRLCAMMAGADSNAKAVKQRTHVHGMDVAYQEADHGVMCVGCSACRTVRGTSRTEDAHVVNRRQLGKGMTGKLLLVRLDIVHADGRLSMPMDDT